MSGSTLVPEVLRIYLITQITSTLLISVLQTRDLILAIDGGAFTYSDQKPAALVLLAYG